MAKKKLRGENEELSKAARRGAGIPENVPTTQTDAELAKAFNHYISHTESSGNALEDQRSAFFAGAGAMDEIRRIQATHAKEAEAPHPQSGGLVTPGDTDDAWGDED